MFPRFLIAGLALLACAAVCTADVHRNEEHQFEADFPGKAERLDKDVEGAKLFMTISKNDSHKFLLGAAVQDGEDLDQEHLKDHANGFIEGLMGARKNASIIKEEELKLSDSTPEGVSYVVKHEDGYIFAWLTIENNKCYFLIIEGASEDSLKSDVVTKFQKSVKIKGVK